MKTAVSVALSCLALALTAPAQATTYYSNINNGSGTFGAADIDVGQFADDITFTLQSSGFESIDLSFFADGLTGLTAAFNGQSIKFTQQANNSYHGSLTSAVFTGPQTIAVRGTSDGTASFSGNAIFGAVPEPATWGLMLIGFGAIGVSARRARAPGARRGLTA